jgi:hypothetical protein
MRRDDVLHYCLGVPGAWQDEPWEDSIATKVGSRIGAFFGEWALVAVFWRVATATSARSRRVGGARQGYAEDVPVIVLAAMCPRLGASDGNGRPPDR